MAGGIHSVLGQFPIACRADSRFRRNDQSFKVDSIPNDTSTPDWVVGQFDVEAALRRHLARETRRYKIKLTHYPRLRPLAPCVCYPLLLTFDFRISASKPHGCHER